jgi:hypothetical protein
MGKKRKVAEEMTPTSIGSKQAWKLMDRGSSVAASAAARDVPALAWRIATGRKPPKATNNPEANTREVLLWAFVGGGFAELMRVVVKRSTANYWVKSTGHLPPGMKPVKKPEPDETVSTR